MPNIPKTRDQIDQWQSLMFLYNSALKEISVKIEILNNEFNGVGVSHKYTMNLFRYTSTILLNT